MAVLATSLWIPYIVGVNITPSAPEAPSPFVVPPDPLQMTPWIARSYRAHQNLLEQFAPFAVLVFIAHVLQVSTSVTQWACIVFVVLRLSHALVMISARPRWPLRPVIFTLGFVVNLILAWQILAHAA